MKLEGEEGDSIRETYEALKAETVEKARSDFEAELKKKKLKKGDPVPTFDETSVITRLPEDKLAAAFKWRLTRTDC